MAVSHKDLTGTDLHEMKGASTATSGQVPIANGAGGTPFGLLTHTSLQTTGNPFGAQLLHVREEQSIGTISQSATTNFTWNTQVLNTVKTNEISGASLASNVITLPAGTYFVHGKPSPYYFSTVSGGVSKSRSRLRNTAAGSNLITGPSRSVGLGGAGFGCTHDLISEVIGRFTLAGSTTIELQTYIYFTNACAASQGIGDSTESYAEVFIWKIA